MRILQLLLFVAIFLAVLCGPVVFTAREYHRRGYPGARRWLRVIVPAQLVIALGTIVVADEFGQHALPLLIVVTTIATSAAGALALWLMRTLCPARLL